jgi:hypothetical protein
MLLSIRHLKGFKIEGLDGDIGHVDSFLFEDNSWNVRYLVVDTGPLVFGKKVLLSPYCITDLDQNGLMINQKVDAIRNSPLIDTDQPVSRHMEMELHQFYQWPYYWDVTPTIDPTILSPSFAEGDRVAAEKAEKTSDPHLRSTSEVIGYHVSAWDKHIGNVNDLIVSTGEWHLPFTVVETTGMAHHKKVLIVNHQVKKILWEDKKYMVDISGEDFDLLPTFDPHEPINLIKKEILYDYFGVQHK